MDAITTITQKGQITLPIAMRMYLGMKPYSKVRLFANKTGITVMPTEDILDIAGSFKPKKRASALAARNAFEKTYHRI